jgi:diacylglycerol kinase
MKSFGFAFAGLWHAFVYEFNLKVFLCIYLFSILLGILFHIDPMSWVLLQLAGGTFLTIELINTALERLSDAFDDHTKKQDDFRYITIKTTKDVAAGASLLAACTWALAMAIIFYPHVMVWWHGVY